MGMIGKEYIMVLGIMLVLSGVMIIAYPPLLNFVVAAFLIASGMLLLGMSYRYKKMTRKTEDPFRDFFMKF